MCTGVSIISATINCLRQIQASAVPKKTHDDVAGRMAKIQKEIYYLIVASGTCRLCQCQPLRRQKSLSKTKQIRRKTSLRAAWRMRKCVWLRKVKPDETKTKWKKTENEQTSILSPLYRSNLSVWSSLPLSLEREKTVRQPVRHTDNELTGR